MILCVLFYGRYTDSSRDLKEFKIFLADKSAPTNIIAMRKYWDKISSRDHHLVVISRI
jgi:hypothetical protein